MSMYTNERDVIKVASFLVINVLMLTTTRLCSELLYTSFDYFDIAQTN